MNDKAIKEMPKSSLRAELTAELQALRAHPLKSNDDAAYFDSSPETPDAHDQRFARIIILLDQLASLTP